MKALRERIASNVEINANGCWIWQRRTTDTGYGQITIFNAAGQRFTRRAHRASYEAFKGAIPDGFELDHRCHTESPSCAGGNECPHRPCVNPDHLEPVTQAENTRRSRLAEHIEARRTQTHCCRGHRFTPENTRRRPCDGRRVCRTCTRERKQGKQRLAAA